eukprot:TRINITY_DN11631_c0_g1_i1.p1 TRINITY_DN11631_c0_g1~~TRINITY_DN11631_c0_g1_i1.p1  ORF type:complete len:349 (-),score=64.75 TRINITY_DN11631_c0_g1_i1:121-1116(-)
MFRRLVTPRLFRCFSTNAKPRVLMTGSLGQIGTELSIAMRQRYGVNNVICSDIAKKPAEYSQGPYMYLDATNYDAMNKIIVENGINTIVHMASLLSGNGEMNPQLAIKVNSRGIENVLECARTHKCKVFAPSTIAAFGPSTPKENTPDLCIMRPTTIYGTTKIYLELLGEYYNRKFGVDFRTVRYPGIISCMAIPGNGTTDYAVEIYHEALKKGKYTCFLSENTALPMMYMPDCIDGTVQLIEADASKLKQRVFNLTAMSFTPKDLAESIKKRIPSFEISYKPDFRQAIADSWPKSLDDSDAKNQWNWKAKYGVDEMTDDMLAYLKKKYGL